MRHSIGPLTLPAPACSTPQRRGAPVRRATTVLLTAALTTGGLASPASAAPGDIVPRNLTITVTDLGSEHRTCRIDADLYVPANVTAAAPGPALLVTNGFGGT